MLVDEDKEGKLDWATLVGRDKLVLCYVKDVKVNIWCYLGSHDCRLLYESFFRTSCKSIQPRQASWCISCRWISGRLRSSAERSTWMRYVLFDCWRTGSWRLGVGIAPLPFLLGFLQVSKLFDTRYHLSRRFIRAKPQAEGKRFPPLLSIFRPWFLLFQELLRIQVDGVDSDKFETRQVFYNSKDGTKVPMYIVSRKVCQLGL